LTQHRHARPSAAAASRETRDRRPELSRNEVTDIIPFNEFGELGYLDDVELSDNTAFDKEAQVLRAPELDDLNDTDDVAPQWLAAPNRSRAEVPGIKAGPPAARTDHRSYARPVADVPWQRGGQHRKPLTGAARGRVLISAMAAGAAAAAAHTATHSNRPAKTETVLAADATSLDGGSPAAARGMQLVTVRPAANIAAHNRELANGVAFAQERAQREARLQQPLFVMPTKGIFTSAFGYRWGVLHAGIDLANSIGTPIHAVSDGVVVAAGPTAGYGMWVKLRHADGTVTLYGHVNTTLVSVGQRVMAGDQIATMGNRGDSTGPHLHFEVMLGGTNRIDPVPWLAKRGLSVGTYTG
jgi:murein DD-endopeptidase MepM/ murein hydrolase activator NlpD